MGRVYLPFPTFGVIHHVPKAFVEGLDAEIADGSVGRRDGERVFLAQVRKEVWD